MEDTGDPIKRDAATSAMDKGWSPKISVKGDYDQFARRPRKEKNKSRDRSPTLSDKLKRGSIPGALSRTSRDSDSPLQSQSAESPDREADATQVDEKIATGDKKSSRDELRTSGVPVTNFPEGPNHGQYTLSRLDSMPPRKQARIEHMKQLRNEPQETIDSKTSPRRLPAIESNVRSEDMNGAVSPIKHMNREVTFSPPVASVVDFLDNSDAERYRLTSFNNTQLAEILQAGKVDPFVTTRFSTKFAVGYIKVEDDPPSKNVVSSMVVRPILPPIKCGAKRQELGDQKSQKRANQFYSASLKVTTAEREGELTRDENERWKNTVDMTYHFQRGSRLRQGHSKYVYRPRAHHSTTVLDATTNSPKEMLDIGGEIEDDFDRVIRWKSKMRYCGKPVMYKRSTSPTLGEEALKRKLTDRLPTRQVHKLWPEAGELYSEVHDRNEYWRRPPSNVNPKLSAMTALLAEGGCGTKAKILQSMPSLTQKATNDGTSQRPSAVRLPPPQIPVRKWRPMWQRMQPKKFST